MILRNTRFGRALGVAILLFALIGFLSAARVYALRRAFQRTCVGSIIA